MSRVRFPAPNNMLLAVIHPNIVRLSANWAQLILTWWPLIFLWFNLWLWGNLLPFLIHRNETRLCTSLDSRWDVLKCEMRPTRSHSPCLTVWVVDAADLQYLSCWLQRTIDESSPGKTNENVLEAAELIWEVFQAGGKVRLDRRSEGPAAFGWIKTSHSD